MRPKTVSPVAITKLMDRVCGAASSTGAPFTSLPDVRRGSGFGNITTSPWAESDSAASWNRVVPYRCVCSLAYSPPHVPVSARAVRALALTGITCRGGELDGEDAVSLLIPNVALPRNVGA